MLLSAPVTTTRNILLLFLASICCASAQDLGNSADAVASVQGVVMSEGAPAANVDVHLLRKPKEHFYRLPVRTQKVKTDARGRYVFADVAAGQYKVWAETSKFTSLKKKLGGEPIKVPGAKAEVAVEPITLHEGCNYHVKILSANTGKPLPTGRVWFGWADLEREYHAGDDGVVNIGGLPPSDWYFIVTADGHEIQFLKTPAQSMGALTELEFKLKPGGAISGVVQTDEGEPVANVKVGVRLERGGMTPGYGSVESDQQGRFRLDNIPLGTPLQISARKDDYVSSSQRVVLPAGEPEFSTSMICNPRPYGGDCIMTIVNQQGQPIENVEVTNPGNSTATNRVVKSDTKGIALLQNLYTSFSGTRAFVRARGFVTQEVQMKPGTRESPSKITVTMQAGKTMRGFVLTQEGRPLPNVRVYYNQGEHPWTTGGRVSTDEQGEFEIDGLETQATLTVYSPKGFAPIRDMPITVDEVKPLTIKLQSMSVIRIRAIDQATGKPIPEFNVRVRASRIREDGEPRGSFSTSYSQEGVNILGTQTEFKMEGLEAGTPLQAIVSAKGYQPKTVPRIVAVNHREAPLNDIELQLDKAENYQKVSGRLVNPNGEPVEVRRFS